MGNSKYLTVDVEGKRLSVELSNSASQAMQLRRTPLRVEMELYFSCLIRKRVRFSEADNNAEHSVRAEQLEIVFKPVMTRQCSVADVDGAPPTTDFPIMRAGSFVPKWLRIDFHKGQWLGEFGYTS